MDYYQQQRAFEAQERVHARELLKKQEQAATDERAFEAQERRTHRGKPNKSKPVEVKPVLPTIRKPQLFCTCGKSLKGKQKKYCSPQCTNDNRPIQRWVKNCGDCGVSFVGFSGSKYCSTVCANQGRIKNNRKCRRCGEQLNSTQDRFCSRQCLQNPVVYCERGCGKALRSDQKVYCSNYCRYNEGLKELPKKSLREMLNL